jgi:hypothetical protein
MLQFSSWQHQQLAMDRPTLLLLVLLLVVAAAAALQH